MPKKAHFLQKKQIDIILTRGCGSKNYIFCNFICVHLHIKIQVSSRISFRLGGKFGHQPPPHYHHQHAPTAKQTPKKPHQIRLMVLQLQLISVYYNTYQILLQNAASFYQKLKILLGKGR